jgi:hypothetical protein
MLRVRIMLGSDLLSTMDWYLCLGHDFLGPFSVLLDCVMLDRVVVMRVMHRIKKTLQDKVREAVLEERR